VSSDTWDSVGGSSCSEWSHWSTATRPSSPSNKPPAALCLVPHRNSPSQPPLRRRSLLLPTGFTAALLVADGWRCSNVAVTSLHATQCPRGAFKFSHMAALVAKRLVTGLHAADVGCGNLALRRDAERQTRRGCSTPPPAVSGGFCSLPRPPPALIAAGSRARRSRP
jgi:hypothetical protein